MVRVHDEEIDLNLKIEDPLEQFPEKFKDSPLDFYSYDFPFSQEDDIDDIV
jgi:hypothetical protein